MANPQIWSWLDIMHSFDLHAFTSSVEELSRFRGLAMRWPGEKEVDDWVVETMQVLVERLAGQTKQLQFKAAHNRATRELKCMLLGAYGRLTWGVVKREFQVFWEILEPELGERRVVSIEVTKGAYINDLLGEPEGGPKRERKAANPLWARVWHKFPSVKADCEEAIYCYALERNTASVFHSMRMAEIGLRALARRMRVTLPKNKKLEWGQWQEILTEMKKKTDALKQKSAGPSKDEALEFYSGAIGQFYGFKDEFRNQVMHVRKAYDEFDAVKALNQVRDFMEKLANKIDEKGRLAK